MHKQKVKLLLFTTIITLSILMLPKMVYAKNEDIKIVKDNSENYMIYIKGNEHTDFEFAFSNDKSVDKTSLSYIPAAKDSSKQDANRIAFINNRTENANYLWVRNGEKYILEGVNIDLSDAIDKSDIEKGTRITKIIEADSTKTSTTEKIENEIKITTTVGNVALKNENGNYSYIIIKLPNSEEYNEFMKIATKISKLNSNTDMYTQIDLYSRFFRLFESLKPNETAGWVKADKNIIYQPEDSQNGDEYIVWIKDNETNDTDVQFLTSTKKISEEKIKEALTTKLPVTYDNNILLIVFGIVIVLIIAVSIRIIFLNKKEESK